LLIDDFARFGVEAGGEAARVVDEVEVTIFIDRRADVAAFL